MPVIVFWLFLALCWSTPLPWTGGAAPPLSAMPAWAAEHGGKSAHTSRKSAASDKKRLHAQPWAFGRSPQSGDSLWLSGTCGEKLTGRKKTSPETPASSTQETQPHRREGVGIQLNNEAAHWRESLPHEITPDEQAPLGGTRHILRAYGEAASDDFSVKVGPEISIKNDDGIDHMARKSEPDASVGMGMRFKLDF